MLIHYLNVCVQDGLFGIFKSRIGTRSMFSTVTGEPGVIASSSGTISTPWDVYQQLMQDFGTKDWIEKQKQYGREGLSEIILFYAGPEAVFRPRVPRKHVTLHGIRSSFQFWPKLYSEVLYRRASCWYVIMICDVIYVYVDCGVDCVFTSHKRHIQ